jgi:tRNA dimethylallyltransferase
MNLIIITGQTATGKTKLALEFAKKYNGELINFDSRQVYKYLDINTGKDLKEISNIKNQRSKKRKS